MVPVVSTPWDMHVVTQMTMKPGRRRERKSGVGWTFSRTSSSLKIIQCKTTAVVPLICYLLFVYAKDSIEWSPITDLWNHPSEVLIPHPRVKRLLDIHDGANAVYFYARMNSLSIISWWLIVIHEIDEKAYLCSLDHWELGKPHCVLGFDDFTSQ